MECDVSMERDVSMEHDVNLRFRQQLLLIDEHLVAEDVAALKFLCTDLLPFRKLEGVKSAVDIFQLLMAKEYLNEENTFLLAELLYRIKYHSLLKKLGYTKEKVQECLHEKGRVSLYRQMLYDLSENITSEMLKDIIFLLQSHLPKRQMSLKITRYKMDGPHRGFCLIINNVKFGTSLQERKGSCKDAEELERVFTWLGLDVRIYPDQTSWQIRELLRTWQRLPDHKDRDCFICCILSHGESGAIYGKDEELVSIRTIMSHFTAKHCPQLAEKPKLFFIQACQGKAIQCPVYVEADARIPDLPSVQQSVSPSESIPEEADFLLGMATIDGYVSFRHVQQGTWYIQALCSKLQLLVPRGEDILSILTEVNEDVGSRVDRWGTKKQMPQPAYTLRRKLIFPIPRHPPPSHQH
ncbi:caspase-10 isoform X1 [Patagioenas fasciata]|uniref:caspase-10 isoform X1 n=1 Tax=Patagioenas fasciata TaxID=372321 RepID=UPI003A9A3884